MNTKPIKKAREVHIEAFNEHETDKKSEENAHIRISM